MRTRPLLLAVCAASACGGGASNLPQFAEKGREPARLVVDTAAAAKYALREEKLEIPFGQRESGTRLVLALMELAQARKAAWVGGLEFLHVFKYKGQLVECATPLSRPGGQLAAAAAPQADVAVEEGPDGQPIYSTGIQPPEPQQVGATVSEDIVRCEKHGQSYIVYKPIYPSHWDVEVARPLDGVIPRVKTLAIAWKDYCSAKRETHHVKRWDFQVKLEWTPPDWELIASRWAAEALVDGKPTCYRVSVADIGNPPRHRMRARLFYRSGFRDTNLVPLTPLEQLHAPPLLEEPQ